MVMHKSAVVVGVEESVFTGQALPWAARQAMAEGLPLVLAHASGPLSAAWSAHDNPTGTSVELARRGKEILDRAAVEVARVAPDLDVEKVFELNDPRTLLLELSATAHLVVLGSHGRGPVRSRLLGSVGLAVARHAACPVIVHRPGHPGRVRNGVVVAAEATADSRRVLSFAFAQAELHHLPLRVLHYLNDVTPVFVGVAMVASPMPVDIPDRAEDHALALAESLAGLREEHPGVHVSVETLRGSPEQGLAELSAKADLVVVGTHQRRLLGRLLVASVSTSVLEHAAGPVAIVPVREVDA